MDRIADPIAEERYPELLRDMADEIGRRLVEAEVPQERARAIAENVTEHIRELHGGQLVYVPKAQSMQVARRWLAIWDEFNGHNHVALARKYGMGYQSIYRIVAVMRERHRKRLQPALPGMEEGPRADATVPAASSPASTPSSSPSNPS